MLTEVEQKELNELRHDSESLKHRIGCLEVDLDDVMFEINCLNKWKKGRWVGFISAMVVEIVALCIEYFYIVVQRNSVEERLLTKASAVEFAVSSTVITFFTILLLAITVFVLGVAIRLMLEIGNSRFARSLAMRMVVKNYYNFMEDQLNKQNAYQRELLELKRDKRSIDKRLKELEKDEEAWIPL